ncbi:hypothetical protein ABZV31_18715 [Streptomyces sp. NPDC005202]|uniref:hypothetical protein n=1 Tax=Streptomyces sp. NPDC005202 TaxID=3157021 RepID=UPI0033B94373
MDSGAIRRRVALVAAVLTASGMLALAVPGTAQAASSCSGRQVKTLSFSTGAVHVYRRDGYVCAMTFPKHPGPRQSMSVTVQARGNRPVTDKGRFAYHAGPVTVHAGHRCVRISGSVGAGSVSTGWILC